jgi:hypothetical protein
MLAGAFVGTTQLLTVCARQRAAIDRQFVAQGEAANIAERVAAMPYEEVNDENLTKLSLSPQAQAQLPEGKLAIESTEATAPAVSHKRVAITVSWMNPTGVERDTRLTTWKYPDPVHKQP